MAVQEIALAAANGLVAAMVADGWEQVQARCAALFKRHAPDHEDAALAHLESCRDVVAVTEESEKERAASVFAPLIAGDLAKVAEVSSEAAKEVKSLGGAVSGDGVVNSRNTFKDIQSSGDFIWSGRDTHVTKEGK
ncbi:hypothetical protein [Nocardiopsis baichengensis]|uniref:hypothetical protein n=1 Tax=Nocardiopsis baichengensis TaxID=280240 RepID=UPI00034DF5DD|nr:hypothetical protein [Nocardiopsis baichengensis]